MGVIIQTSLSVLDLGQMLFVLLIWKLKLYIVLHFFYL